MGVKCCFQIWEKRGRKRKKIILPKETSHWKFLSLGPKDENNQPTPPSFASFALKAYGSNCGETVSEDLDTLRPKSWHWIQCEDPALLIKRFKTLDFSLSKDTARQDSLGRAELIWLYEQKFKNT